MESLLFDVVVVCWIIETLQTPLFVISSVRHAPNSAAEEGGVEPDRGAPVLHLDA